MSSIVFRKAKSMATPRSEVWPNRELRLFRSMQESGRFCYRGFTPSIDLKSDLFLGPSEIRLPGQDEAFLWHNMKFLSPRILATALLVVTKKGLHFCSRSINVFVASYFSWLQLNMNLQKISQPLQHHFVPRDLHLGISFRRNASPCRDELRLKELRIRDS